MPETRCPMCGKSNLAELESCQFCGARLKPLLVSKPDDSQPVKVGENPVKTGSSEFEKVEPSTGDIVHAGEAPTRKNTAELEPTLPSWLRSLREGQESSELESTGSESSDQDLPFGPVLTSNPDSSGDQVDWLSGLSQAAAENDEETPDWLANLRGKETGLPTPASAPTPELASKATEKPSADADGTDWVANLRSEADAVTPETTLRADLQGKDGSSDWSDTLKSEPSLSNTPEQPEESKEENNGISEWLSGLSGSSEDIKPDSSLKNTLPDWLNPSEGEAINPATDPGAKEGSAEGNEPLDWLTSIKATPGTPEAAAGESQSDWLSGLKMKTGPEAATPASKSSSEIPPSIAASEETPSWLTQFKEDISAADEQEAKKEQFEESLQTPANEIRTGPLPDWLAGIENASTTSDGTPALIANDEGTTPGGIDEAAYSMEIPDWLSKLNPKQAIDKNSEGEVESLQPDSLEISELPSWVQAMRPVESVMSESMETPQEDAHATEQSGPLAGLHGVLPASPGLGPLRKPPVYSTNLQVTDGQQRYAAAFERLISSETQPRTEKRTQLTSSKWWRWLIAGLLILAVGLPLSTGLPVTPASDLQPPEMINAFTLISSLPSDAAVLVVFDYEPALSGELESAAAPLIDHLMQQGPRLALISTNPTGSALAERFLHDPSSSPLVTGHNYQSGQQYVNLGYLAGGSSGVLWFAISPTTAAPFTLEGQKAWQLPPLQGIQKISDFDSIIILSDNADSGRVWIEQAGSLIGNTPILMVISAQAEPLILPYYDSGQIKGLVTGLAGGEAYGQTYVHQDAQAGMMRNYWNSFSLGILVAELLILTGGLWSLVTGWRVRNKQAGEVV